MTEDELQALLGRVLPPAERQGILVEEVGDQDIRLRFAASVGGFSQADLLVCASTALRAVVLPQEARLINFITTFLAAPSEGDAIALARVIRRDRDDLHAEAWLFTHAPIEPALHATATLRPR